MSAICALAETIISAPFRHRRWRARKTIICIVMSLQSPEGRLAYIASRANVGCQIRQTQRCARKGYMLIVIGARTDYVICATERSRRPHHDDAYRRGCHPLDVPSGTAKGGGKMTNRNNDPNHVVVDLDLRSMEDKGSRMKKAEKPRICDILDVEVGEWFRIHYPKGTTNPLYINAEGLVERTSGKDRNRKNIGNSVAWAIEHPESVEKVPRFSAADIEDAMTILRWYPQSEAVYRDIQGGLIICDNNHAVQEILKPNVHVLPSIRPGKHVLLQEIIKGATP